MPDSPTPCSSLFLDNPDVTDDSLASPQIETASPDPNLFTDYELLTSSEYLQEISPFTTKLVEIIGILHMIRGVETVKCKNGTVNTVCTFYVHNNDGEKVQCAMWGDVIEKFIDKLIVQHVIHIDGAFPKQVPDNFNSGTTPYELILQSNTIVTDLGKIKPPSFSESNDAVEVVSLTNVAAHKKIIAVQGFVKTPWAIIQKQNDSTGNTCFGSIAADKYFLDVKISDFAADYMCEFIKGQHVQCLGSVIRNGNSFFFCVQAPSCITLVDSKMATLKDLLICKPLMKLNKIDNAANGNSLKKLKTTQMPNKIFKKN